MGEKETLLEGGRRLAASGLTVETWGNLSLRDEEGRVYITPSGMDYLSCTPEDIVVVDMEGRVLEGARRPSTELGLHLAVYRARSDVGAVVHTHAIYSTVFATLGREIPLCLDEAAQTLGDTVRVCHYALPGSQALARYAAQALEGGANACLLRAHGAVCVGRTMDQAFRVARVLEMTAEICWRALAIGEKPEPLPEVVLRAQREFMADRYGQR